MWSTASELGLRLSGQILIFGGVFFVSKSFLGNWKTHLHVRILIYHHISNVLCCRGYRERSKTTKVATVKVFSFDPADAYFSSFPKILAFCFQSMFIDQWLLQKYFFRALSASFSYCAKEFEWQDFHTFALKCMQSEINSPASALSNCWKLQEIIEVEAGFHMVHMMNSDHCKKRFSDCWDPITGNQPPAIKAVVATATSSISTIVAYGNWKSSGSRNIFEDIAAITWGGRNRIRRREIYPPVPPPLTWNQP